MRLGICSTIEKSDIATFRGAPLLAGMMGVSKPGYAPGEGPQRLVMNMIPSNQVQVAIDGDMAALPTDGQWRCIVLRDGEVLFWSSDDLRCCFYIFSLPVAWHKYMAFTRRDPVWACKAPGKCISVRGWCPWVGSQPQVWCSISTDAFFACRGPRFKPCRPHPSFAGISRFQGVSLLLPPLGVHFAALMRHRAQTCTLVGLGWLVTSRRSGETRSKSL